MDAYKKQLNFLINQEIQFVEKETAFQKARSRLYLGLFIVSLFSMLAFGFMSFLLKKRNDIIQNQKVEIETITNSVPIGLCKIDKDFDIVWANKNIKKLYDPKNQSVVSVNEPHAINGLAFEFVRKKLSEVKDKNLVVFEGAITQEFQVAQALKSVWFG